MRHAASSRRATFRRLAGAAAGATLALIALGGVVRVSGSGMGCGDDWPLCHGRLLPPLDLPAMIEYAHRLAAALVSVLVASLAALAWLRHRREPELRGPATLAAVLLLLQVLIGAVTVKLALTPATVVLHLATAMVLLAVLLLALVRADEAQPGHRTGSFRIEEGTPSRPFRVRPGGLGLSRLRRLAGATTAVAFITILLGGAVANLNAGPACRGFPLCEGSLVPAGWPAQLQALHRLAAFSLLGLLLLTFRTAVSPLRQPEGGRGPEAAVGRSLTAPVPEAEARRLTRLAGAALGLALLQISIAVVMVVGPFRPEWRAVHMVVGTLLWATVVMLTLRARLEASVA